MTPAELVAWARAQPDIWETIGRWQRIEAVARDVVEAFEQCPSHSMLVAIAPQIADLASVLAVRAASSPAAGGDGTAPR